MDEDRFHDELRRFWDEIARDDAAALGDLDPELAATIRNLHALADVPPPDPRYAKQARERLLAATSVPLATGPWQPSASNSHSAPRPRWLLPAKSHAGKPDRRWSMGQMATAAVLAFILVAGLVFSWQRSRPQAIMVSAPVATAQFDFLWRSTGGPEVMVQPQGLAIDPRGNLWVVDSGRGRFQIFAPDGTFLETWGLPGSTEGQFNFSAGQKGGGGDIAFDAAGNFYVTDPGNHRIQKFAPDRSFLHAWGSEGEGDGQFITPKNVAVSPDGSVYICDEVRRDVQKFDAEGRFLLVLGAFELEEGKPATADSVAIDGQGFVWVADQTNNRLARFSPDGKFLNDLGVRGTRPGEIFRPTDLAIDKEGLIYVADRSIKRIQLFAPDGRFLGETRADSLDPEGFSVPLTIAVGPDGVGYIGSDYSVYAFRVLVFPGVGPMP